MSTKIEHFSKREIKSEAKIAVFCIGVRPTLELIKFYSRFKKYYKEEYDFYYIADDDGQPLYYEDINVMQVSKMECSNAGFQHSIMFHGTVPNNAHVCAWDKALYIASKIRPYDHYWMIEEDVFISSLEIFKNVDEKTKEFDLVCKEFQPNFFMRNLGCHPEEQLGSDWVLDYKHYNGMSSTYSKLHNSRIGGLKERFKIQKKIDEKLKKIKNDKLAGDLLKDCMDTYFRHVENIDIDWIVPEPHIHCLFCAGRISRRLLNKISDLARDKGALFSQEYIFPTLCLINGFKILTNTRVHGQLDPRIEVFQKKFNVDLCDFKDVLNHNPIQISYRRMHISTMTSEALSDEEIKNFLLKDFLSPDKNEWLYLLISRDQKLDELSAGVFYHPVKNAKMWSKTLDLIKEERQKKDKRK